MVSALEQSLVTYRDKNAFYIREQYYSYGALQERAQAISSYLNLHNTSRLPVGVIGYDAFETYAAIIGIMLSGAAYVPIHPANPMDRNTSIIEQSELCFVFAPNTSYSFEHLIDISKTKVITVADLSSASFERNHIISPNDIAYILFTSGSTGVPKGVPITHHNLESFIDSFFALGYELNSNDRFLQMFDITFDLSVMSYLVPLLKGACAYTVPFDSVKYMFIYELLENHKLTFTLMVPSILSYLRPYFSEIELPELKYSLFCGEALYADITQEWKRCIPNAKVQNVYGPTEATIFCMTYDCSNVLKENNGMVCIGNPVKNCDILIVDEESKPTNAKGELCLGGPQVTQGYLKNEEKNASSFFMYNEARYYRTGDLAYADKDGEILYAGRKDYQVKVMGGFRVELSEIEHHVRVYTSISGVAAVAVPNAMGISQIFLFVEQLNKEVSEVIDYLKTQMPEYMIPAAIHSLVAFPLNSNGKTDRKELEKMIQHAAK